MTYQTYANTMPSPVSSGMLVRVDTTTAAY